MLSMFSKLSLAASATACSVILLKSGHLQAAQHAPKYKLCQVQVVFRHGARTPLYDVPFLPKILYEQGLMNHPANTHVNYKLASLQDDRVPRSLLDESYIKKGFLDGGCMWGQLTSVGAEQCYELGRNLRKRYVEDHKFLSADFSEMKRDLYVRSTHVARTVFSARSVLAGLVNEYGSEPITIHVTSAEQEMIYPNYTSCAQLQNMTRWAWLEPDKVQGITEIKNEIGKKLRVPDGADVNLIALKDNFVAAEAHNKPSPYDTLDSSARTLLGAGSIRILKAAFAGIPELRSQTLKLAIGPFLDILLTNMENHTRDSNDSSAKFNLFSGHDTTLVPLLCAFGIPCDSWPPYASHLILELYEDTGCDTDEDRYYVKLLYNGEEQCIADQVSPFCPLSRFVSWLDHVRLPMERYLQKCANVGNN